VLELRHIGKRIAIGLEDELWLLFHLMIAGRLHWRKPGALLRGKGDLAAFDFPNGSLVLTESGTKKQASLHIAHGLIYPREDRPIRDLLRKRSHLVRLRTSLVLSLQNIITRNNGVKIRGGKIMALTTDHAAPFLEANEDLALAGKVSKASIDFLTRQIKAVEATIEGKMALREPYTQLVTIHGVGKILGLTIMLETGPISRFDKAGNYVSYCRKVSSKWISNDKGKGKGNKKKGNKYLAWAFSEAAELACRYYPEARAYYNRKLKKTNVAIAHAALAHKLARAAYSVMRDQVPFMPEKFYGSS
jgi:transposase